jgi:hypothetical protein
MLVGHLAVAFAAKRVEPRVSLGALVLAAMLPDLRWCLFLLAGIEEVRFQPGLGAANYLVVVDSAWSHSLLMGCLWGALLAGAHYLGRRQTTGALLLGAGALSHWFLDVASHPKDMPLVPEGRISSASDCGGRSPGPSW